MKYFALIFVFVVAAVSATQIIEEEDEDSGGNQNSQEDSILDENDDVISLEKRDVSKSKKKRNNQRKPCYCKHWRILTQCIITKDNAAVNEWIKSHKGDPTKVRECTQKAISSNPEPTSLVNARKIIGQILNCSSWRRDWKMQSFNQSIWEICKANDSDSEANYICSLEAPLVQQAAANPTQYSNIYKGAYGYSNITEEISLSGGCAVCPLTNGLQQCQTACSAIYGTALTNSSCVKGRNSLYPDRQECICAAYGLNSCPADMTEVDGYCYKYQPTWTYPATQANSQCLRNISLLSHLINVRTKQEWDSTLKYILMASSGYTYEEPFWIGINHQENRPWSWYLNGTTPANNVTDYLWAGSVWAENQPDYRNDTNYWGSGLFPVGAVAVYNTTTKKYEIFDDVNIQPSVYSNLSVIIKSICQATAQSDFTSADIWVAANNSAWEPSTTAAPATSTASPIPFCESESNDNQSGKRNKKSDGSKNQSGKRRSFLVKCWGCGLIHSHKTNERMIKAKKTIAKIKVNLAGKKSS